MNWTRGAMAFAMLGLTAAPCAALAADGTLTLVIGGEAYDGPPKFAVTFDNQPLGEGAVAAAIDTAITGRFADAADKAQYVQSFTFRIPEDRFTPDGEVRVRLMNEAYGGDGSNRDRNLYVASVAINGRPVTASGFTTVSSDGVQPNAMLGEFLVLYDGNADGVAEAPQGGWPAASDKVAAVVPNTSNARLAPSLDLVSAKSDREVMPEAVVHEAALRSEPLEPMETAHLDPDPEGNVRNCDIDELYNVVGFNENSNELTPKLLERLDQIAQDIGDRQCNVQVTGYSSRQGSYATNALFAVERAQNSLRYLQERGVKFVRASAAGVGATDQFGPDFRANRRVVITVTP